MLNHVLPPDTQAILLLCANFGQSRQIEPQPLTLSEYNSLAEWLREQEMRPAHLLEPNAKEQLSKININKLDPDRLLALIERGAMLSLAVERWTSRGLWVVGRSDTQYPKLLKQRLRHSAPAILYGVGNIDLLSQGGLAVVGSRDVDEELLAYTRKIAETSALEGMQIISGAARGVDQEAMLGILNAGGTSVGVLADSLTKASVNSKYRSGIKEGRLTLISSYDPDAGFNTGNAMGRNKYIYALADYALVVNSSFGQGGTWSGAVEALSRLKEIPVFVRITPTASEGNRQLHNQGAKPFPPEPWYGSFKQILAEASYVAESTDSNIIQTPPEIAQDTHAHELSSTPQNIYEAVLPFILVHLQQPKDAKTLAQSLEVQPSQMQEWLKKAVQEGKVRKINKPVAYVANQPVTQLSLLL
ncbi:DNA-processing protein DprA [Anabaena subtropica]|uniref:DNA-protecting protein DprA n=1 Tax=Anabaena subtropica FACHB-260 TaxID=2692884 RepID=A0ABR8CKE4_9NOST|nr:DNA-processing protein DprA [Anabaena subtropica]MBD2342567.1 DNA-protecting protein DprA [Anabaena subtropica FACHB-260]